MTELWMDGATRRDLSRTFKATRPLSAIECVVGHVTAGGGTSPYNHFKNTKRGCSTFWVGYSEGLFEQYLPFDHISYCEIEGGKRIISVEFASPPDGSGTLNAYQLKMWDKICTHAAKHFGVPRKLMKNTSDTGLGYHRMGVKGNFPSDSVQGGYNQRGGVGPVWSSSFGKVCPGNLRCEQFAEYARSGSTSTPEPSKPAPSKPDTGAYTGGSIVDYLNSLNRPSSFAARSKLAAQYGIKNYKGTAAQNTQLLKYLRQTNGGKSTNSGVYKGASLVDYLTSIKSPSSFSYRSKLAATHGIKNYRGTAAQNTRLLKLLRGF